MRENINKVSQRGERLDSLQDKTDNLAVSAQGFRRGANRVRKQMWWKDMKMRMCLIVGIIILLIVIIVPAGESSRSATPGILTDLTQSLPLDTTKLSSLSATSFGPLLYICNTRSDLPLSPNSSSDLRSMNDSHKHNDDG